MEKHEKYLILGICVFTFLLLLFIYIPNFNSIGEVDPNILEIF